MLNIKNNCALKTMEKQIKSYEIVFDYEYEGRIVVGMHHQLAHCLEDALRYFTQTVPYEEIFEIKYQGLRVINREPKEGNSV